MTCTEGVSGDRQESIKLLWFFPLVLVDGSPSNFSSLRLCSISMISVHPAKEEKKKGYVKLSSRREYFSKVSRAAILEEILHIPHDNLKRKAKKKKNS